MGYNKLFWGFIFLFDIRIGGFDLLPDVLAYFFFYQGLSHLAEKNHFFEEGRKLAFPMIFFALLDLYQVPASQGELVNLPAGAINWVISIAAIVISMLLVYKICMGVAEEARNLQALELEQKAMKRWDLYLISNLAIIGSILMPALLAILVLPIILLSWTSYLLLIGLMRSASQELVST